MFSRANIILTIKKTSISVKTSYSAKKYLITRKKFRYFLVTLPQSY